MRKNLTIEEVDSFIVRGLSGYLSEFTREVLKQLLHVKTQKDIADRVRNEFFTTKIHQPNVNPEFQMYCYCYFIASNRHWKLAINRLLKAGRYSGRTKKRKS